MAQALAKKKDDLASLQDPQAQIVTKDKVTLWLDRVKNAMTPFLTKQRDLEKKIRAIKLQVTGDTVRDQKAYDAACELYRAIAGNEKDATNVIDPVVEIANMFHKGLTSQRKPIKELADINRAALAMKIKEFDDEIARRQRIKEQEEQRKAQAKADQERRDREKAERDAKAIRDKAEADAKEARRIADEAADKARRAEEEARKKQDADAIEAASKLQKDAAKLEKVAEKSEIKLDNASTDLELASAVREEQVMVEIQTSAPLINRTAAAFDMVDNWKGTCDEPLVTMLYIIGVPADHKIAHPELLHLIEISQSEVNTMGEAQKQLFSVPGCRAYNEPFKRARRG